MIARQARAILFEMTGSCNVDQITVLWPNLESVAVNDTLGDRKAGSLDLWGDFDNQCREQQCVEWIELSRRP